jgi:hypothetical protein
VREGQGGVPVARLLLTSRALLVAEPPVSGRCSVQEDARGRGCCPRPWLACLA